MATTISFEHHFPNVPLDLFEKHLNDPLLNDMLKAMPSFKSRELVSQESLPKGERVWRFQVAVGGELPASVAKIIPQELFSWREDTHFFPKEHCLRFKLTPRSDAVKFSSSGTWRFFEENGGTKRVIEATIDVKIPFVGKMIEAFIAAETKRNFEVEPTIQMAFFEKLQTSKMKTKKV